MTVSRARTSEYAWLEAPRARADGRRADRGRPLRAAPAAVRALRRAADRRRRRLVRHDAGRASDDPVLYSIGRVAGWIVEVGADLPRARVPARPAGDRIDRALVWAGAALVAGCSTCRRRSWSSSTRSPSPWTSCDAGLPRQRVHGGRLRAGVRRRRRPPAAGAAHRRSSSPRSPLRLASRIRRASPLTAPRARARAGRRDLPPGRLALAIIGAPDRARLARPRGRGLADRARGPADWRSRSCVGLVRWRLFIAAATQRLAARLRAHPASRRPAGRARRGLRRPVARDRLLARRRRGALGRRRRAGPWRSRRPGPAAAVDRGRATASGWSRRSSTTPRSATTARSSTRATSYAVITLDNHRLSAQTSSLLREVLRVARPHPGGRRRRAPADRARPARRRPATARRAADQARARRRADRRRRRRARRAAARAGRRGRAGARRGPLAGARHLSRRRWPIAAWSQALRVGGAADAAADDGPRRRRRALPARGRERRVLLLPGGAAERGQARPRRDRRRRRALRRRRAADRGPRRRRGLRRGRRRRPASGW